MKHLIYAQKIRLVGNHAADRLLEYARATACATARAGDTDTVTLRADGMPAHLTELLRCRPRAGANGARKSGGRQCR